MPCHFIPLNTDGETIEDLELQDNQAKIERQVSEWLRASRSKRSRSSEPNKQMFEVDARVGDLFKRRLIMTPGTFMSPNRTRNLLPLEPFRLFQTSPMRLLGNPFTAFRPSFPSEETMPFTGWTPLCDIYETDKKLVLKMELPEMKKEDVHVTVESNLLTVRGEGSLMKTSSRRVFIASNAITVNSFAPSRCRHLMRQQDLCRVQRWTADRDATEEYSVNSRADRGESEISRKEP